MARHRSPQGRRTHLGLPLPPLAAAAGAGGRALASAPDVSLAPRVIATVLAGGALAAAGQAALDRAVPVASDGIGVLTTNVHELLDGATTPVAVVAPLVPAVTRAAEPQPVDVAELVKAAELHSRATARATEAAQAARPTAPTTTPRPTARGEGGPGDVDVQMIAGRVTSGFGARWGRQHRGLDVAAPIGTPIRVPLAGEVVDSGPASGFGLWVRVRHDDGTVTTYGHVNRAFVHVGERVEAGQKIAEVGNRGHSTGPHLHMEVQTPGGTTINPRPWLDGRGIGY